MSEQGILVVVSGFSGAGKGTLIKAMLEKHHNYALSISATTRAPRQGEEDGREYFFVTREKFEEMIREGQLIEYARYVENYYGTPRQYVFQQMADGKDVILEIEIQGALKIKERFPDALLLFVMPPSADELKRRLVGRGTETMEVIDQRLHRAAEEAEGMTSYDYILINDKVDTCVEAMHQLIQAQHRRVSGNLDFIQQMKSELKAI
ncbi:MAG: guanylate kinase [Hungatella sp.]|nr:guanylate kinase [Hungatella sp.]MCI9500885.1 guanylate kinase [Hungatella sp.]